MSTRVKLVNVQSLYWKQFSLFLTSFVETLVEKAQYEEAAEKSLQLETKVCRLRLFILFQSCNNTNMDHCLFDDSSAWAGSKDEKIKTYLTLIDHGVRPSLKILRNRTVVWRAMVEALCLRGSSLTQTSLPLVRHRASTIALHRTQFFVIFSASPHSKFTDLQWQLILGTKTSKETNAKM